MPETRLDDRVSVSRRIAAPAEAVFAVLADPANHPRLDGSGMLRSPTSTGPLTGVGQIFGMRMHNDEMGDYEMLNHVVEFEPARVIGWEPELAAASRAEDAPDIGSRAGHRWSFTLEGENGATTMVTETFDCSEAPEWLRKAVKGGRRWTEAMTATLERLDERCTGG